MFVEVLSLLPLRSGGISDDKDRRRPFFNWLQGFCISAGVMAERHSELCGGLFQHIDHVLKAYKHFGGFGWFHYDESFRQKLAVHSSLRWGMKDLGLWLNLILPQKSSGNRALVGNKAAVLAYRKGVCFAFNESQCKWSTSCRYRHECLFCAGRYPVAKCYKKVASAVPVA